MDTEPSSSLSGKKPSLLSLFTKKSNLGNQKDTEIENLNEQVLSEKKDDSNDTDCENENIKKKKVGTTLNKIEETSASTKNEK
ncbi:hypothetical protein [Plasmodium yoelii yoelii]|nr:hypothetical protein [Plasmodium yoelii yoelii]